MNCSDLNIKAMNSCLFCTAPSSSPQNENGRPVIIKREVFVTEDEYHPLFDPLSESGGGAPQTLEVGGNSAAAKEHLKASFILDKILKLPQHSISQLLQHHFKNGQFHPPEEEEEVLLNVCSSCTESVALFYETLEQVSELQKKLVAIEVELKWKMQNSRQVLVHPGSINEKIRSQVLNGRIHEATQEGSNLDHQDFHAEIESDVVEQGLMGEESLSEKHHLSFMMVDHLDQDENDETEETEFKLRLEYMEQNENGNNNGTKSSLNLDPLLSHRLSGADGEHSSKEGSPIVPVTRKLDEGDNLRSYACTKCPYRSTNNQSYLIHVKTHEKGSGFEEEVKAPSKPKVRRQKEVKEENVQMKRQKLLKYYKCPECAALVSGRLRDYRDHEEMHAVARGFNCPQCGWLVMALANHKTKWHPKDKEVQMPLPRQIIKM